MNELSMWIMGILALIIVGTIIDLLMHNTRMHKFVRAIFATIVMLVVLTPIAGLITSGFDFGDIDSGKDIVLDEGYLEFIDKAKVTKVENAVVYALKQDKITGAVVKIKASFVANDIEISQVDINLSKVVIDSSNSHINKYTLVLGLVCDYLKISEDKIKIYG